MLFRKTPTSERGKYVYRFNDSTVSVIAEGSVTEEWIKSLPSFDDADQELYRLYFIEEYSQEEIAKMKGVSQNTIPKKLRRIAKQLTEMCRNAV